MLFDASGCYARNRADKLQLSFYYLSTGSVEIVEHKRERLRNVAVMEAQPLTRVDKGELTWGSGGSFSAASPGTHV